MRKVLREAAMRADVDPLPNQDSAFVLQEIIDRLTARWRHASDEVDKLTASELSRMTAFGPSDHEWIRAENSLGDRLSKLLIEVEKNDIASRHVRVEEARVMLMIQAIQAAATKVGIPRDQVRALGPAIREQLEQQSSGERVFA